MNCSTPGFPVLQHLLELAQTHVHWVSDAIQPSLPLSSPSSPTFYLSQHEGFFIWVSSSHQVAKDWHFSFSISPSNEYSGLISFRIDWFDLLPVKGTLKSLFQHHSSKASILQCSAFFMAQLTSVRDYWKNHSFNKNIHTNIHKTQANTQLPPTQELEMNLIWRIVTFYMLSWDCQWTIYVSIEIYWYKRRSLSWSAFKQSDSLNFILHSYCKIFRLMLMECHNFHI